MAWDTDSLLPVERMLRRTADYKVVAFDCPVDAPEFRHTDPINNDVLVVCGSPVWFRRDGGRYRLADAGSVLIHRAGTRLERRPCSEDGDRCRWIGIRPELFHEALDEAGVDQCRLERVLPADPMSELGLAGLAAAPDQAFAVDEQAARLFARSLDRMTGADREAVRLTRRQQRLVTRARLRLARDLDRTLSLTDLADELGCSRFHLCRVFRTATGETLHGYRTRLRLRHALRRLSACPDASLTELALELGFSSHSHFTATFRKFYGIPPSVLRVRSQSPLAAVSASLRT